jgi:hypothetical protein
MLLAGCRGDADIRLEQAGETRVQPVPTRAWTTRRTAPDDADATLKWVDTSACYSSVRGRYKIDVADRLAAKAATKTKIRILRYLSVHAAPHTRELKARESLAG